ncbi:serine hydrolase [Neobacillus niacini]|uniref:serine hydrolase n=1 Tax=Neobacillus niacini TaxID=86668 RepID=UPI0021CB23FE|nr:serine hydrolase [Neobacillus niacini]MCM3765672.1 serine hydrolase [Neobacillus niacini]
MKKKLIFFLLFLSFSISLLPVNASASTVDLSKKNLIKIKAFVNEQFNNAGIVGGSYAIVSNNKVIDSSGVGYRDLKLGKKATDETIYAIASVTKSFTATAILQLQEQGKMNVNDPVQKYLPWFTYKDEEKSKQVTIQHLLTHAAGVSRFDADGAIFIDEEKNKNSLEASIRALRTVDMKTNPGEKAQYCNSCFNTLGLIIEKVTGVSYYEYVKRNIFEPLGMEYTGFGQDLKSLTANDIAKEYSWFFGFRNTKLLNYREFGKSQDPEGGIYTNSVDLAKYVSGILGHSSTSILSQKTLKTSYIGILPTENNEWKYTGGGMEAGKISNRKVLYKGGDGIGSSAVMMLIPEDKIGVVLLIGESNSEPKQDIAKGMLQILIGEEAKAADSPLPLFKLTGFIMLFLFIASILGLVVFLWAINKRLKRKDQVSKYRWLRIFISLICFLFLVVISYLLLFVRPTQIGFYGYPYDWAIGLISLGVTLFLGLVYNGYLSIFGKYEERRGGRKNEKIIQM